MGSSQSQSRYTLRGQICPLQHVGYEVASISSDMPKRVNSAISRILCVVRILRLRAHAVAITAYGRSASFVSMCRC